MRNNKFAYKAKLNIIERMHDIVYYKGKSLILCCLDVLLFSTLSIINENSLCRILAEN